MPLKISSGNKQSDPYRQKRIIEQNRLNEQAKQAALNNTQYYTEQKANLYQEKYNAYTALQKDSGSKFYNPYSVATNRSVSALNSYGIDTSNINDDWYNQYSFLNQYLRYDGTSNTPSKPGKKSSDAEKAAYEFYQVWKSEEATKKAEQQWKALQKDITYWTQRSDRNLSDEEILGKIDWSKYGELTSMEKNAQFQPNEYNRAIGYSKDAMQATIWAARNGGGTGDTSLDYILYMEGVGNQYKYNPEIASKLDPTNQNYNPYSLGSTDLDEEAAYFNTPYFAQDWCSKHAYLLNGSDEDKRYYQKVYKAEQDTLQGEQARDALYKWIENYEGSDYEKAQKAFDRMLDKNGEVTVRVGKEKYKVNFSVLNAMDLSMGKNGSDPNGQVVALTRGIDYKYSDALRMLQERCNQNAKKQNDIGYIEENSGSAEPKSSVPETDISKDGAAVSAGLPGSNEIDAISSADKVAKAPEQNIQSDSVPEPETKRQAKPPVKPITLPDQANEIIKKKNQNVSDGIELAGSSLTDQEINTLGTYSASSGEVKEFMKTVPTSDLLNNNTAQTAIDFAGGMVKTSVGYLTYGNALAKLPSVEAELSALTTAVSATQDELNALNDLKEMTSSPYVPDWLTADMYALQDNPEDSQAYLDALVDIRKQVTGSEYNEGEFNFNQAKDWADYIFNNDREMVETAYEGDKDSRIKDLQQEQMVLQQQKDQNKNAYGEYEQKNLWFDAAIAAYEEQGLDTSELLMARAVSDYLTDMATYQPTVWSSQSYYDDLSAEGKTRQEIDQIHSDQATLLENARFVKEYVSQNGIDMPEEIAKNLDRYIAALERDELDYQYYSLKFNDDFGEKVAAGIVRENEEKLKVNPGSNVVYDPGTKGTEIEVMAGLDRADYFALMNDDEVKTYYYLYGTEGRAAAYEYYKHLTDDTYGILNTRQTEQIEEAAKKEVDANGWSGGWANFKAILSSAPEAILGLAYMIDRAITQEEYNPNAPALTFGHYSAAVNAATMESILNCCGRDDGNGNKEHTLWSKAVSGLYEIIYNRGRSAVNAAVFNFFGPDSAVPDIIKELVGASPMAFGAASMAIANAKDKGASDGQAYTIGMATLLSESLSEAITVSNIREAFGAGDLSAHGFKEAVIKWLTQDGVEEMFGESVTDIVENLTDEMVMGELSDHAERVRAWKEKDPRLSDEEAELLARQDEVAGVLHTALISYLSPGLDLTAVAYRSAHEQLSYYRYETRRRQRIGDPTNLMQVRRQYQEAKKNGTLYKPGASRKAPSVQSEAETRPQVAPLGTQIKFVNGVPEGKLLSRDIALMQSVINSVPSTKNDAISQVLNGENATAAQSDEADAAASNVSRFFGGDQQKTAEGIKTIVTGAYAAGIKNEVVKQAVKVASLSESSQASKVMSSEEFQSAAPEQKAQMLADTVEKDSLNSTVQSELETAVYENRITKAEGDLIADGALASLKPLQVTVDAANSAVSEAQKDLKAKNDSLKAATDNLSTVNSDYIQDPSDSNYKRLMDATTLVNNADESVHQYEQHLAKTQENLEQAEGKLNDARESAMADIRQQAQETVAQQDQERAEIAAQQAEQERIAQEQQAEAERQQKIADQRSGKTEEESNRAKLERLAAERGYTGEQAEKFIQDVMEFASNRRFKGIDMSKQLSKSEGYLMMGALSRRFGVNVEIGQMEGNENGYYDPNTDTIRLNSNLPAGQILVEFALHELTHSLEKTGAYGKYQQFVLNALYPTEAELNDAVAKMMADREEAGHSIDEEQAKKELVAEFTRLRLNDKAMVQRMVDAGLGGQMRNILHNINQFLKNKLTKQAGINQQANEGLSIGQKQLTAEDLRRAERLFQKAIQQRSRAQQKARTEAIKQANTPTAKLERSATPVVTNSQGDAEVSEVRGGTISRTDGDTEYSVASWTDEERARVRAQLKDRMISENDGSMTEAEMDAKIDKWINDVNDIAYIITQDRNRLDYTADPEKTMLKPNAEYVKTLDASTLCAKRLLYQGTFDAIQHLLPNTPLMPEDLIDLANMMRDMGYEAPCGICYVESRRRQLGKFTEQWLESYEGEYKPTLDEVTTSDGLENLRTTHPQAYQDFISAMNKKGTMNPKVVQLRTDYRGEISQMTPAQVQKVKDIGGLRVQSFSDFETPHLIDMMQAVMDMSSQGLTAQAYTKVPNFPWVFGDTGIKINLSLIGKGTGLDENGNLLFDDVEGMPFDEAMKLRNRYGKNVGTILVGINDQHILAAMADDRIDFIIPFHKSGWSKEELTKMPVLNGYSDYTDSQNEKVIVGKDKKGGYKTESLDKSKRVNFQPVGENGYWDFSKSGKENAEAYLRMCAEDGRLPKFSQFLVDNGDGSFSLQPDGSTDGYWKTLIDFKMYDNEGNGAPQQEVSPEFNMDEANRVLGEYSLERNGISRESNNDLPVAQEVVDAFVQNYKDNHPGREYSAGMSEMTDAQKAQAIQEANVDYMDAVARGDMEAAQEDVDFAAEQNGYTDKAYHGTSNFGFTVFDMGKSQDAIFVSYDLNVAGTYAEAGNVIRRVNESDKLDIDFDSMSNQEFVDFMNNMDKKTKAMFERVGMGFESVSLDDDGWINIKIDDEREGGGTKFDIVQELNKLNTGVYELYTRPGKQLVIETDGASWNDIPWALVVDADPNAQGAHPEMLGVKTRDVAKWAKENGYDSVRINNIYDDGGESYDYNQAYGDIGIFFNQNDVKSADPVTYDDNGNVIPLGQRFSENADIRYSTGKAELSNAQKQQLLLDAEIVNAYNQGRDSAGGELNGNEEDARRSAARIRETIGQYYPNIPSWSLKGRAALSIVRGDYSGVITEGQPGYELFAAALTNSEVRSKKGKPIVWYHGSKNSFSQFEGGHGTNFAGSVGFYFTSSGEVSGFYAGGKDNPNNIYPVGVYVEKPAVFLAGRDFNQNFNRQNKALEIIKETHDTIKQIGMDEGVLKELNSKLNKAISNGFISDETAGRIIDAFVTKGDIDSVLVKDAAWDYFGGPANNQLIVFDSKNIYPATSEFWAGITNDQKSYSVGNDQMTDAEMNKALTDAGIITQEEIDAYQQKTSRPLEGRSARWSQEEGLAQRQFGSENGMLQESDEIAQQAIDYVQAHNAYFPDTNEGQIVRAINWIRKNGSERGEDGSLTQKTDGYYESVKKVTSKTFDYRSADGQARMIATMAMAVAKNDVAAQVELADAFNRQGTDLGRALQARKLFRLMTPEGRIASLQKMMQNTADELGAKGINADLKFSDWIYRAAAAAVDEADFRKVQQAAAVEIASQIPANWRDKFRSWRMLSMLGNPRTHIRNVIGNAFFVPVVSMKNKLGAIAELGLEKGQRTKTLAPILSSEIRQFARQDAITMKDTLTGEAKFNETNMVQREQKAFKGLLQALIDFNGDALEKEDWIFLKGHYRRALGGWMQANGYTADQLRSDPALLEQGRAYAVQEAQKATYRDFNKLAATLNKVSRDGGVAGFLTDAVLPFKKTPANILRRGVEYSPVGIMKSLTADLYHLKQYKDYQNGKLSVMPEKAITPTQFIDDFCSGLAGTAVMAVGFLLGRAGIVSCGLGDDDDEFEKAKGNQKYALKFNIGGHDFTFTMDWAAPMSMPFFVGAAVQEQFEKDGDYDIEALLNAFGNITEPVFNLSMLDGVNSLLKITQSNGQDSNTTLTQIGGKIMSNYATSYVPSLLGAITRTIDDKQRKAYVESGKGTGLMGTFRYAREQTENKIPGLSQTNIPMRDIWGEENTSSLAERILENFILPGYINEYRNDPIIDEMARLWEATGDKALVPDADPDKTITYNKQKHVLTAEQWDLYKENRNKTAHEMLTRLIESEDYQNATDAAQAQMIKNIWSYADKIGKQAVFPDYEVEEKGDPVAKATLEGKVTARKTDMMTALETGDYDGYDAMVEALHELGVEDSEIKTKIGNTYRDQYKEAYRKGDEAKMAEIEDILDNTGFDFDIDKWEEQVDEKYGNNT